MVSHVDLNHSSYLSVLLMRLLVSFMLLTFSSLATTEEMAEETSDEAHKAAIEIVEQLHTNLLEVMQAGDSLSFAERYAKLEPTITASFDTSIITKVILSRYWKDLTQEQQENFIDLFNRQSIATYASRFNSFSGEIFATKTVEQLKKGRLLVRSEIQSSDGSSVSLDYLMHRNITKWYIISVIADGVNDLSLKRAEYSVIIKKDGYEKLVKDIEKKVEEMENRKDK